MSYQRAVANCRRCYELGSSEGISARTSDDRLWKARNEAFEGLEDFHGEVNFPLKEVGYSEQDFKNVIDAMNACMNCTFKKPEIAEIFDPSDESV